MKRHLWIIGVCALLSCDHNHGKRIEVPMYDFYEKCRKLALSERELGQEYFFSIKGAGINELSVKYMGDIITAKYDTLRILNSVNYSGQLEGARRGTGRVFIYDVHDKLVGFYAVGGAGDIPSKVENGALIFSSEECDQSTSISLKDSIPRMIFVRCTEKGGDIYNLETDPSYRN